MLVVVLFRLWIVVLLEMLVWVSVVFVFVDSVFFFLDSVGFSEICGRESCLRLILIGRENELFLDEDCDEFFGR